MDSRRMVTVRVRIGVRQNFTRDASQSHSAICGNAARSCRFYIYHMTDLFSSRLPPDSESELQRKERKRGREREKQRIARYAHRVFLSTMKSASHRGNPATIIPPLPLPPPEHATHRQQGTEPTGGKEDAGDTRAERRGRREWRRGGFRMDFARFNGTRHVDVNLPALVGFNAPLKQPHLYPPLRSLPSPLFYPLDPPPTYATLSRPFPPSVPSRSHRSPSRRTL